MFTLLRLFMSTRANLVSLDHIVEVLSARATVVTDRVTRDVPPITVPFDLRRRAEDHLVPTGEAHSVKLFRFEALVILLSTPRGRTGLRHRLDQYPLRDTGSRSLKHRVTVRADTYLVRKYCYFVIP